MSRTDRVIDLPNVDGDRPARDVDTDRASIAPGIALLALYPISQHSTPFQVSALTRDPLDARAPVIGVGLVLPHPTGGAIDDVMEAEYVQVPIGGEEDLTDEYEEQLFSGDSDDEADAHADLPEEL